MAVCRAYPTLPLRVVCFVDVHRLFLWSCRIELLFQPMSVVAIVFLEGARLCRKRRDSLRESGFEHKRHRGLKLMRFELGVAAPLEGVGIGPMRQHGIVQRRSSRNEASAGLS